MDWKFYLLDPKDEALKQGSDLGNFFDSGGNGVGEGDQSDGGEGRGDGWIEGYGWVGGDGLGIRSMYGFINGQGRSRIYWG